MLSLMLLYVSTGQSTQVSPFEEKVPTGHSEIGELFLKRKFNDGHLLRFLRVCLKFVL